MRVLFIVLALVVSAGSAFAQSQATPGRDDGGNVEQAVPPLPGEEKSTGTATQPQTESSAGQTPTEQEDIVPGTPNEETLQPSQSPSSDLPPSQPEFDRDAVPQSTAPEREDATTEAPVQPSQVPATDSTQRNPDVPESDQETVVPAVPGGPAPDQPDEPGQPEVQPDVVPDRRFETFDLPLEGGTPEAAPPTEQLDEGGTRSLPPGGYGIGGGGPS